MRSITRSCFLGRELLLYCALLCGALVEQNVQRPGAGKFYPFFMQDKDRLAALDWMCEQFDDRERPY